MTISKKKKDSTELLVEAVVLGLQERKGSNISVLDLRNIESSVCQFFVLCNGESTTHVSAVADSVEEMTIKTRNDKPFHIEGKQQALWVLLDYVDVVVHVFHKSIRQEYNLEELWADAPRKDIENLF